MKALSFTGLVLALVGLALALYNQLSLIPRAAYLRTIPHDKVPRGAWAEAHSLTVDLGLVTMGLGALALILALVAAIKTKNRIAFVALALALPPLIMGLARGTHLFS